VHYGKASSIKRRAPLETAAAAGASPGGVVPQTY